MRDEESARASQLEWERTPGRANTRSGADKEEALRDSGRATKKTRAGQLEREGKPGRANACRGERVLPEERRRKSASRREPAITDDGARACVCEREQECESRLFVLILSGKELLQWRINSVRMLYKGVCVLFNRLIGTNAATFSCAAALSGSPLSYVCAPRKRNSEE